jgi:hypothetical protein
MSIDIDKTIRRTQRHWYEDGLSEIGTGTLFVAMALLFWAQAGTPPGPLSALLATVGLPAVVIGGALALRWGLRALKERYVFPRTGYVSYRQNTSPRRRLATGIVGGLTGILVSLLLATAPASRAWIPALQGVLVGGVWLYSGSRVGLARYYALAVASVLLGGAASLAGLGDLRGSVVYFGGMGLGLAISGACTLIRFLRHTQLPAEESEHGG